MNPFSKHFKKTFIWATSLFLLILGTIYSNCGTNLNKKNSFQNQNQFFLTFESKIPLGELKTSVTLTPKVFTTKSCGYTFQSIILEVPPEASTSIGIHYTSVTIGSEKTGTYSISLPEAVILYPGIKTEVPNVTIDPLHEISPTAILAPNFPILPNEGDTPEFCAWTKKYVEAYNSTSASLQSSLFLFEIDKGEIIKSFLIKNETEIQSQLQLKPEYSFMGESEEAQKQANIPSPTKYFIIAQNEYIGEAQQLANYRNAEGITTEVQVLEQLPGYDANTPTPPECTGIYEHECYFYPATDTIVNGFNEIVVSGAAVAGMEEFVKPPTLIMPTRLSDKRGIIRAAIRKKKANNPGLKAVLLIGDQDMLPYSATEDNPKHYMNMGTDLYYSDPFSPLLLSTGPVARKAVFSSTMMGLLYCDNGSGNVVYRPWCLPNEQHSIWYTKDATNQPVRTAILSYGINYPRLQFSDEGNTLTSPPALDPSTTVVIARLKTYSRYYGHDPLPENYITKLISWENHLPRFLNNSFYTEGGSDVFFTNTLIQNISNFIANYGTNSKLYLSDYYLQILGFNSAISCLQCAYIAGDDLMTEITSQNRTSWRPIGHGSYKGFNVAPSSISNPTNKIGYLNHMAYDIDDQGHIIYSENNPQVLTLTPLAKSNGLIGHVISSACDANQIMDGTYFADVIHSTDPTLNVRNVGDSLVGMANAGAINTYLNNNVGFLGMDDEYDISLSNQVKIAWLTCGRFGDAIFTNMILNSSNRQRHYQIMNRVLNGDPFAKIASPAPGCPDYNPNSDPLPD